MGRWERTQNWQVPAQNLRFKLYLTADEPSTFHLAWSISSPVNWGSFVSQSLWSIHFCHVMSFAPFVGAAQTYILRGSWVISSLYQSPSYISIKKLQNKQLTLDSDPYQIVKGVADCTLSTRVLQTNTPVPVKVSDLRWCWFHLQRSWRTPSSELRFYPAQIIREGKGWDQTIFGWIRSIYTLFCTCSQGGMRHLATNVPVNMSKSWECDNLLL